MTNIGDDHGIKEWLLLFLGIKEQKANRKVDYKKGEKEKGGIEEEESRRKSERVSTLSEGLELHQSVAIQN